MSEKVWPPLVSIIVLEKWTFILTILVGSILLHCHRSQAVLGGRLLLQTSHSVSVHFSKFVCVGVCVWGVRGGAGMQYVCDEYSI